MPWVSAPPVLVTVGWPPFQVVQFGNVARFLRRGCERHSNLVRVAVVTHAADPRAVRLALFARRDLMPGEELLL